MGKLAMADVFLIALYIVIVKGVGLATVSELSITAIGLVVGLCAVVGAAQQQVWTPTFRWCWWRWFVLCRYITRCLFLLLSDCNQTLSKESGGDFQPVTVGVHSILLPCIDTVVSHWFVPSRHEVCFRPTVPCTSLWITSSPSCQVQQRLRVGTEWICHSRTLRIHCGLGILR